MKNYILIIISAFSASNGYKTYELLPSAHEYKIVVNETEHTTIYGTNSAGHNSTQYFTQSRERYLLPKDAFDIAIRHKNMPILREALHKFELFEETVEITAALNIICDQLLQAKKCKKNGYWFGCVVGTCGMLPWFSSELSTKHKAITSGVFAGFAGIMILLNRHTFKQIKKIYSNMINELLNSRACITKNKRELKKKLTTLHTLLSIEQSKLEHLILHG